MIWTRCPVSALYRCHLSPSHVMSQPLRCPPASPQVSRWVFTLNNYPVGYDFKSHLSKADFRVRRAVFGYEVGAAGTRHLQGYVEFERSQRLCNVRRIFPLAHWEPATGDSVSNFLYCSKDGEYETVGCFEAEQQGYCLTAPKALSVPLVLRGLLCPRTSTQVKVSKMYADKQLYFDKMTDILSNLRQRHDSFSSWKEKFLYTWQYNILKDVLRQDDRQILWVCDPVGNRGKTFLAQYLLHLYSFQLFDGILSSRDTGVLFRKDCQGVCFDVSRTTVESFSYHTLECLKNGVLITGKFHGRTMTFPSKRIVVFSNDFPNLTALSMDRWKVVQLGEGDYTDLNPAPIVNPAAEFPFVEPPPLPDLSEDFNTRDYIEENAPVFGTDYAPPLPAVAAAATAVAVSDPAVASTSGAAAFVPPLPRLLARPRLSPSSTQTSATPPSPPIGLPLRMPMAFHCTLHPNPREFIFHLNLAPRVE